jgi:uncharacterized protein YrrD
MEFQEGAAVRTSAGETVGTVDKIVVDPGSRNVTHLVVGKGFLRRDSLVPVRDVEATPTDDTVVLSPNARPEGYEAFEGVRYTAEPGTERPSPMSAFEVYPITGVPPMYPGAIPPVPTPAEQAGNSARVAGEHIVEAGLPVRGEGGRKVGKVEEVVTRADGSIDAFVAKSGLLWWARRRVIPAGWVREIRPTEIRLSVTKHQVAATAGEPSGTIEREPPAW